MLKLKQTVVVEGRYDKSRLANLVDARIITTDGFDIFKDRQKLALLRALAEKDGLIILTDSDAAGFRIRSFLTGAIPGGHIVHVYIPDILGKEPRKEKPGAEGKLGVEGIPDHLLLEALGKAGLKQSPPEKAAPARQITQADLMEWGLCGGQGSFQKRKQLLKRLELPERMGTKAMLGVLNSFYGYDAFLALVDSLGEAGPY